MVCLFFLASGKEVFDYDIMCKTKTLKWKILKIREKKIMEKVIGVKNIEKLIFEVRGKQVMLDSDLARLYGCKNGTKR